MAIELGKFNQLEIIKEVDFGLYLDGGEEGNILLPSRYVPYNYEIGQKIDVREIVCTDQFVRIFQHFIDIMLQLFCLGAVTVVIHRTGNVETDSLHVVVGESALRHLAVNGLHDVGHDFFAVVLRPGRDLPFLKERTVRREQADLDCSAADVGAECICLHVEPHTETLIMLTFSRGADARAGCSHLYVFVRPRQLVRQTSVSRCFPLKYIIPQLCCFPIGT